MEAWQAKDSINVRAPAERIFETLRNYNHFGRLFGVGRLPRGYSTRIVGTEPLVEEGSVVGHRMVSPVGRLRFKRRVETLEPNKRIIERYLGPHFEGTGTWQLEEFPEGVKVSFLYDAADTSWRSRLIYRLAGPVGLQDFYGWGLRRLKRKLESED